MFDLSGHVALITGGNGGLGLAMGKGLVKAGASVAIWGRNPAKNAEAVEALRALGGDAEAFVCEVTDAAQIKSAFEATLARFGKVDSCFANAGGSGPTSMLHQLADDKWLEFMDLNLNSVVMTYKAVIAHLLERRQGGKLIVTSSAAAILGTPLHAGYSTTKAAVVGLTRALAIELGRANIQVNAILPGYIETDMSLDTSQAFRDACKRRSASGEVGKLEDMEGIAVFLAAPESRFMTGQTLVLDGGQTIHPG
ncbi:SDR family NAD(P)-dependent oxidoreductase [Sphingomonas sp. SUN039]|uniref:SDR family NAD(P)-dependent oxidoreductase n=1 Tax=Sphingomonas sp. SUN039 TaxID=2937787 RepID=UPI0021640D8E|nr:SDR family NAD(P)-dependent oxidoreductase [Sphingomonas sp. SUN039]UVO55305.1 SDR family oxidoreductase [Sphingomonas sp. SUN039]